MLKQLIGSMALTVGLTACSHYQDNSKDPYQVVCHRLAAELNHNERANSAYSPGPRNAINQAQIAQQYHHLKCDENE